MRRVHGRGLHRTVINTQVLKPVLWKWMWVMDTVQGHIHYCPTTVPLVEQIIVPVSVVTWLESYVNQLQQAQLCSFTVSTAMSCSWALLLLPFAIIFFSQQQKEVKEVINPEILQTLKCRRLFSATHFFFLLPEMKQVFYARGKGELIDPRKKKEKEVSQIMAV